MLETNAVSNRREFLKTGALVTAGLAFGGGLQGSKLAAYDKALANLRPTQQEIAAEVAKIKAAEMKSIDNVVFSSLRRASIDNLEIVENFGAVQKQRLEKAITSLLVEGEKPKNFLDVKNDLEAAKWQTLEILEGIQKKSPDGENIPQLVSEALKKVASLRVARYKNLVKQNIDPIDDHEAEVYYQTLQNFLGFDLRFRLSQPAANIGDARTAAANVMTMQSFQELINNVFPELNNDPTKIAKAIDKRIEKMKTEYKIDEKDPLIRFMQLAREVYLHYFSDEYEALLKDRARYNLTKNPRHLLPYNQIASMAIAKKILDPRKYEDSIKALIANMDIRLAVGVGKTDDLNDPEKFESFAKADPSTQFLIAAQIMEVFQNRPDILALLQNGKEKMKFVLINGPLTIGKSNGLFFNARGNLNPDDHMIVAQSPNSPYFEQSIGMVLRYLDFVDKDGKFTKSNRDGTLPFEPRRKDSNLGVSPFVGLGVSPVVYKKPDSRFKQKRLSSDQVDRLIALDKAGRDMAEIYLKGHHSHFVPYITRLFVTQPHALREISPPLYSYLKQALELDPVDILKISRHHSNGR